MRLYIMTVCLSAVYLLCLQGCAANSTILTESDMIPIIPKGAEYTAIWDGKQQKMIAEQDRVAVAKGTYLNLVKEADKCSK